MNFNFSTLIYLFLRLSPFVLICFFSLLSIFNSDLKGIVYLFGISFTILANILLGNLFSFKDNENAHETCNVINLGNQQFSSLPIGQSIIGFTSSYLISTLFINNNKYKNNSILNNWPTIIFFIGLICSDLYWNNFKQNCYTYAQSLGSYSISISIGILWAFIITNMNTPSLQFFPKYKNNEMCKRTSKQTFECKVYKNGKLIDTVDKV